MNDIVLQLATLYAKGWFKEDEEFTILRKLLSMVYGYDMSITDISRVLLNKYSEASVLRVKEGNYQRDNTIGGFLEHLECFQSFGKDMDKAILLSILSSLYCSEEKLARFDFKIIGVKNYGHFRQGMTYKYLDKYMNEYKWCGRFSFNGNYLEIK